MSSRGPVGEALPDVFERFKTYDIKFRRAEVNVIASGPGAGKTVLGLTLARLMKVPTLYVSPDSSSWVITNRLAAMVTGDYLNDIELAYQNDRGHPYDQALQTIDHVMFSYQKEPWLADIRDETKAFEAAWGEPPSLIVVDCLRNIQPEDMNGERGWQVFARTMEYLHGLAGDTGACIIVLHHLVGLYEDSVVPAPQSALEGKVSKLPAVILTLAKIQGKLRIAIVKNRSGDADTSARKVVELEYHPAKMYLGDPE